MITDDDIIRILSDPRFRRTVRAICRLAFTDHREEEPLLAKSDGMLTPEQACERFGMRAEQLQEAIEKRWVRAEDGLVDAQTVRQWWKGREKFLNKEQARAAAIDKRRRERPVREIPEGCMTMKQAAEYLGLDESTVAPYKNKGVLADAGAGLVTRESVEAYAAKRNPKRREAQQARRKRESEQHATDEPAVMTNHEAAEALGTTVKSVAALAPPSNGYLVRAGRGMITRASVEALLAKRAERKRARVPQPEPATA